MQATRLSVVLSSLALLAPLSATDSLGAALVERGTVSFNARLRYEGVQQTNVRPADALTLRTRLGYTTGAWQGFKAMAEAENIASPGADRYSQSGLNPAATGRAVVADPETTETNQLFVAYATGKTTATLGRQRLVLDQARVIGDVGWRQNMQTFDAFVVQDKSLDQTTLTYSYLDQVNRVFSARHAQGKWASDSHVLHASYAGFGAGTLTGYAYMLDFGRVAAANSCATYGGSVAGTRPVTADVKFTYRAELATQSDYGASPLSYTATYAALSGGLAAAFGSLGVGYEQLGSDNNVGFKTPLATLHAFNGWADLFLATPAAGLRETNVKATANLPEKIALAVSFHHFTSDVGSSTFGRELDAQLSRKFGKYVTGLVKIANFRRDSPAFPNVRKIWTQVEVAY